MLKADRYNKFPSEADIEDVLTSAVFGSLCYLDDTENSAGLCLLKEFLEKARFVYSDEKNSTFKEKVKEIQWVKYKFWPTLGGKEPDLIIECHGKNYEGKDYKWTLIIEAKYGAPKSGTGEEFESDSINSDGESTEYNDQLAVYYKLQKKEDNEGELYILYVTHHTAFPTDDIKSSLESLEKMKLEVKVNDKLGWLPWRELSPLIQEKINELGKDEERSYKHRGKMELLEDLYAYLWKRGLAPFTGEWGKRMGEQLKPLSKKTDIIFYANIENNKGGQNGR
jgi:hypothetical protein